MPRIMTMNGDHQSVAIAPLDLRTTNRERGSTGSRIPDGTSRVREAGVTGGSPAPPACTGTDSLEKCCPAVRDALPGSATGAPRKRPVGNSSNNLPFRKRRFPVEPETQRQSPAPAQCRDRLSPAVDSDVTLRGNFAGRDERRVGAAPVIPMLGEEAGQGPDGYPLRFLPFAYGHIPLYSVPPILELNHTLAHQTEHLLSAISMATHQDEDGDTALHIAVVHGQLAIVCKLIQLLLLDRRSLDIHNNLRQTPLHLAVITQQANMVEALVREGANPAVMDRNGQTAIHLCCEYNQSDCLSIVLSCLSSLTCLEVRNYEGLSPLHLAVLRGHKDLVRLLLEAGANINAMDIKSGQSPLMHAVETNNADMVHFLIECGCDVNSQSYSGNTALHSACGRGQVDTVRLLLKSGADSSLKNYHNDTPVMVAKNKKIADVLRGRGSNQIKIQDQHCMSVSPHGSNLTENESSSPSHSRGCSPLTTPHAPHHNTSHPPKTSVLVLPPFS